METKTRNITALENPFLGLQPFTRDKSYLYFGRQKHVNEVVDKLVENRFSAVLGKSGIGKSSFIFCGIFPLLETKLNHDIYTFTPGTIGPLVKLINTLFNYESDQVKKQIFQNLLVDVTTFFDYYKVNNETVPVLYVDQFEELFSYDNRDGSMSLEIVKFVELLVVLTKTDKVQFHVLLTMRSDFIGNCADYPALTKCINQSQFLIPQMSMEEKKEAIINPLKYVDVEITEDLLQLIQEELGNKQDQLPSMQHAMMRTFEVWRKEQLIAEPVSTKHYTAVGGIKNSLSIHANEIFNTLNDDEKLICEKLFRSITTINKEGKGIRNPSSLERIMQIIGVKEEEKILNVITTFRKKDRAFLQPREHVEISSNSVIDITHESLMRSWELLKEWTVKETESIKRYVKLAEDAQDFQKGSRSRLRQPELQISLNWRESQQPTYEWGVRYHSSFERTMEFLTFSEKEEIKDLERTKLLQKRRNQLSRILVVIFLFLGIGGVLLGVHAYQKSKQAELKKEEAEKSKKEALASQKRAEESRNIAEDEKNKAQAEKKNAENEKHRAEHALLVADEEKQKALKAMLQAELSFAEANEQKELANNALERATVAQINAESANSRANRLQNISTARAMALNSYQLEDNEIRYLLAKQAVLGYMNNRGDGYDAEFYAAFHMATKTILGDTYNLMDTERGMITDFINTGKFMSVISFSNSISLYTNDVKNTIDLKSIVKGIAKPISDTKMVYYDYSRSLYEMNLDTYEVNLLISYIADSELVGVFKIDENHYLSIDVSGIVTQWNKNEKKNSFEPTIVATPFLEGKGSLTRSFYDAASKHIFIATDKGYVFELSLSGKQEISNIYIDQDTPIWALNADNNTLFVGTEKGEVQRWVKENKEWRKNFSSGNHKARINEIAVHPIHKNLIATAGFDGTVRLWDIDRPKKEKIIVEEKVWFSSLIFSDAGDYLYTGSQSGQLKKWPLTIPMQYRDLSTANKDFLSNEDWSKYVSSEINYDSTFFILFN
ncbi:WD40 repeat domain-containing protein [Flammeovirga kamogawensis]|uniref:Novel STAND NTPase 1 domain-containing protein n=1 Tax=Flammeovirga kamogawensis TaxID=373891 RepID=A0ABX8GYH0_9BACT|nr:WD40 repeat domain-containing protein [Flammeovirga kamogawensis]MBB6458867.1 hypothetical protein [Flammeovirga kamogawensis]QWG08448.1 hypothetical protein KM029_05795 [Flammeovirga kamogawensis]TRX66745.1 hypothetical protein EO216_00855 [Flammeovirga kamogawensis]